MQPRDLSDHVAYQAGRGVEEVARELGRDPAELVTLSSNENMHGPSPLAVEAIRETASGASSYPKAVHADLTAEIADRWDVDPAQVWLANGGDGAIDYLSRAMLEPSDGVLVPSPGFAYYGMSARFHHGDVDEYVLSRADDFTQTAGTVLDAHAGERIVYLTSPHNPSGSTISLETIERIADGLGEETLVVVDEAYGEFADVDSAIALVAGREGFESRDDVAVLRTFSKAYGLAGLRLGYAVVPDAWAEAYARVNTPFAASEIACRAGLAALEDDEHVRRTVETARWGREYMRSELETHVWPSGANFVLAAVGEGSTVDGGSTAGGGSTASGESTAADAPTDDASTVGDASAVTTALQERGVVVRDCTSFGLPGCVRITCGTEAETERAVEALNEVLADGIATPIDPDGGATGGDAPDGEAGGGDSPGDTGSSDDRREVPDA